VFGLCFFVSVTLTDAIHVLIDCSDAQVERRGAGAHPVAPGRRGRRDPHKVLAVLSVFRSSFLVTWTRYFVVVSESSQVKDGFSIRPNTI